jgi:deoxyribonuclease-4
MNLPVRIGLKLHSTNTDLIPEAEFIYKDGYFDFIELYIIPDSYEESISSWQGLNVPYVIHAPHSFQGVNFAQSHKWETNQRAFREAQRFADTLGSNIIIVHGGHDGSFDETLRQLKLLKDRRIALENKPKVGLHGEVCVGWSPEEFQLAIDNGVIGNTVLDFGHALYASNSAGIDSMKFIRMLLSFNPKIFHITDGNVTSEKDMHLNFGEGNLHISDFMKRIPHGSSVTLETPRDQTGGLKDFKKDVQYLEDLIQNHIPS